MLNAFLNRLFSLTSSATDLLLTVMNVLVETALLMIADVFLTVDVIIFFCFGSCNCAVND